jgi:protoporphyrinogen oxidase
MNNFLANFFSFFTFFLNLANVQCQIHKIAIIGCGIGGTSQAYYLANSLKNVEIHIFDENKSCGGRVKNVRITQNYTSEVGANFFIPQNELIMNLIKELNLTYHYAKGEDSSLSFWDGKQVYFELGNWKLINLFRMFYRYGLTMLKAKVMMNEHFVKFIKFYTKIQSKGPGKKPKTFSSLKAMLKGMKLLNLVNNSTWNYLHSFGLSENFIEEFFQSIISSIYNQDKNINAFAGFVTLCALFNEPQSITGGNNKLIKRLLQSSKSILKERIKVFRKVVVFQIEKTLEDQIQKYKLKFKRTDSNKQADFSSLNYDYVIFAIPISQSKVSFINSSILSRNFEPIEYKRTVVSFIAGDLNYQNFNFKSIQDFPYVLLSNDSRSTIVS